MDKERIAAIVARASRSRLTAPSICGFASLPMQLRLLDGSARLTKEITPMRHIDRQPHIDRRFDIDETTSDTQPAPQGAPLAYGKAIDADRLAAVSLGGGLWNGTAQQLIPILPESHPRYRESRALITETIQRWGRGDFR